MNDGKHLRILTIVFNTSISQSELPFFRGAVVHSMGGDVDLLCHNHVGSSSLRYSYPLVQYKVINGKASVVCMGDGVEAFAPFLLSPVETLKLGGRRVSLATESVSPQLALIDVAADFYSYKLSRWVPLNDKNFAEYKSQASMKDKIDLLERILIGNILSMAKGVGIIIQDEIKIVLTDIISIYTQKNKGVTLCAFDVEFTSNVSLPDYIGLGKHASIGFGVICRK